MSGHGKSASFNKKKRWAYRSLTSELGLPPPITDRKAADAGWSPKSVKEAQLDEETGLVSTSSSPVEWIVSPMTISTTETGDDSNVTLLIDFLESAMLTSELVTNIENKLKGLEGGASAKKSALRNLCFVLGKENLFTNTELNLSTHTYSTVSIRGDAKADRNKAHWLKKKGKYSKSAEQAIIASMRHSENNKISNPKYEYTPDNPVNCAVSTIFVNAVTSREPLGGSDTTLFLNYIPNTVLSRAVPFLEIGLQVPEGIDRKRLFQAFGASLIVGDPIGSKKAAEFDAKMMLAPANEPGQNPDLIISNDTFNMPQTLARSRPTNFAKLNYPDPDPVDQFTPLAVIQDFDMKFEGSDFQALKRNGVVTGNLKLIFPDKTKLKSIDTLLLSSNGELRLTVEFGWSLSPNSDRFVNDKIMAYVNAQRMKMVCTTTLGSINYTDSGSAEVNLKLISVGDDDQQQMTAQLSDIVSHISLLGKAQRRYRKFALNFLGKTESDLPQDAVSIASTSDYVKRIRQVLAPAGKPSLGLKTRRALNRGNADAKSRSYALTGLAKIKTSPNDFKDSAAILEKIEDAGFVNSEDGEGFEYFFVKPGADTLFKKLVQALHDVCDPGLTGVKRAFRTNQIRAARVETIKAGLLKAIASDTTLSYLSPPAGRKIAPESDFGSLNSYMATVVKYMNHNRAYFNASKSRRKQLKPPTKEAFDKIDEILGHSGVKVTLFAGTNFKQAQAQLNAIKIGSATGNTLMELIRKNKEKTVFLPVQKDTEGNFTLDKEPAQKVYAVGVIKQNYPKTLVKPQTTKQAAAMIKRRKKAKSLPSIKTKALNGTRMLFAAYTDKLFLSNGYVCDKSAKVAERFIDAGTKVTGLSLTEKDDGVKIDDQNLNIIAWWHRSKSVASYTTLNNAVYHGLVQPLYASGDYEEIQIVYFKYNDKCGRLSGCNIGDTPIKEDRVETIWRNSGNKPMAFTTALLKEIGNVASAHVPHGFKAKNPKKGVNAKNFADGQTIPVLEFHSRVYNVADDKGNSRKLLRLLFMDRTATSDGGAGERVINSMRNDGRTPSFGGSEDVLTKNSTGKIRNRQLLKALEAAKIISPPNESTGERTINMGPKTYQVVKSALKAIHPHVNYGPVASGIRAASISGEMSGTEQMEAFVKARRNFEKMSSAPKFPEGKNGEPASIPVSTTVGSSPSVTVELVGCPLLQVGACYFVDFYTNTDIDNFYIVRDVEHKISSGFTTSATLVRWDANTQQIPGSVGGLNRLINQAGDT